MLHSLVTAIYPHQLTLTQTNLLTGGQTSRFLYSATVNLHRAMPRHPRIPSSANPSIYTQSLQLVNQTCTNQSILEN